ncbi:MAG: hypothetical protein BroJett039_10930 [Chloroflexota bacterium]|nr:MAG: hypothetical protein BroJett039_10930 [Chloroflexota bacterium]
MNNYSALWRDFFLTPFALRPTAREKFNLARGLFLSNDLSILDARCGVGRHARELSARGYHVTGANANAYALETARREF